MKLEQLKAAQPFWDGWEICEETKEYENSSHYVIMRTYNGKYEKSYLQIIRFDAAQMIKVLDKNATYEKELLLKVYRKIYFLENTSDQYLLKNEEHFILRNSQMTAFDLFLRLEFLPCILESYPSCMEDSMIIKMAKDCIRGLLYCVTKGSGLLHGTLSPEQIFVRDTNSFCIGHFSYVQYLGHALICDFSNHYYVAPEIRYKTGFDSRADIYSLGRIMEKMRYGLKESKSEHNDALGQVIAKACEMLPENRYQTLQDFYETLIAVEVFDA